MILWNLSIINFVKVIKTRLKLFSVLLTSSTHKNKELGIKAINLFKWLIMKLCIILHLIIS